jgi:ferric-dicitrate binding protein FerR (iron transport regulator)
LEKDIHDLILKSLLGEASTAEKDILQQWLEADETHLAEYEQLWKSWKTRFPYKRFANAEEEFDKLWHRAHPEGRGIRPTTVSRKSRLEIYAKIAAAILVLLTVGFLLYNFADQGNWEQLPTTVHKHTSAGQKSRIFLEDGTQVWLNSSTEVTYPETFQGSDERSLHLRGEAYFSVAKNQAKPFRIECRGMLLQVLGTEFNVDASRNDRIDIALVEGSVSVQWEVEESRTVRKILSPGEMITIRADGSARLSENFDAKGAYGWKDGMLYFKDASLEEVVQELELWYGVEIRVQGRPEGTWQYSGEFDNYVLEHVLLAMSFAEEFEYELDGDTVHIMFN